MVTFTSSFNWCVEKFSAGFCVGFPYRCHLFSDAEVLHRLVIIKVTEKSCLQCNVAFRCLTAFFGSCPQVTGLYVVTDIYPFHLQARKVMGTLSYKSCIDKLTMYSAECLDHGFCWLTVPVAFCFWFPGSSSQVNADPLSCAPWIY